MPIADVRGIEIHYEVAGKGEPLLLIAGLGSDLRSWTFQMNALRKCCRVLRLDNRGAGRSSKPPGPYTTRMMSDDAIALMDHLGIEKAHVIGLSMGGMIAQEVAINYPTRVDRLILGCTFGGRGDESGPTPEYERIAKLPVRAFRNRLIALGANRVLPRLVVSVLANATGGRGWEEGFQAQRGAVDCHNALDRLHLIGAPTLVIAGTHDRVIRPTSAGVLARAIPHARLVMIPKGSHMIGVESRIAFNREMRAFLWDPDAGANRVAAIY